MSALPVEITRTPEPRDLFAAAIDAAVETALRKALHSPQRLLSIEAAGNYLSLSKSEIYNMISRGELPVIKAGRPGGHGRGRSVGRGRTLIDVQDLNNWIASHKI